MKGFVLIFILAFGWIHQLAEDTMRAKNIDIDWCDGDNVVFKDGEELIYKIYYNFESIWIPAGEVHFKVKEYEDKYAFSVDGTTYASYNWFFKVKDHYQAMVDKESLLPMTAEREVVEGSYQRYEKVVFDHRLKAAMSTLGKTKEKTTTKQISLSTCVHDLLSVVYFTRNVDVDRMTPGSSFPLKIYLNRKTYDVQISYIGVDKQKTIRGLGDYRTKVFRPELLNSHVFKKGDEMTVWVTDDKNKLPLMIESDVSVGKVKVILKSYKDLRYDLDAKL